MSTGDAKARKNAANGLVMHAAQNKNGVMCKVAIDAGAEWWAIDRAIMANTEKPRTELFYNLICWEQIRLVELFPDRYRFDKDGNMFIYRKKKRTWDKDKHCSEGKPTEQMKIFYE